MISLFINFTMFLLTVIFKLYDSDGNGKVSFNDILEVLRDLSGSFMSDEQREVSKDIKLERFFFFLFELKEKSTMLLKTADV